jgi:hypothetical protein
MTKDIREALQEGLDGTGMQVMSEEETAEFLKRIPSLEQQEALRIERAKEKGRPAITEKDIGIINQWLDDARKQTLQTLPAFMEHVLGGFEHDYGTICRAITACAVAAAWAANEHEQGDITGFQAGQVMWGFICHWTNKLGPMQLIEFSEMLYPNQGDRYEKVLDQDTWSWLQTEAAKQLRQRGAHFNLSAELREHWQSIVEGKPPFGYRVADT